MHVRNFLGNRRGNIALMSAILTLPLLLAVGLSVDYSRYASAQAHLQDVNDMVAITLASSPEQNVEKLRKMAEDVVRANHAARLYSPTVAAVTVNEKKIEVELTGNIPVTFMSLAGKDWLAAETKATAERAASPNTVEVALILDNTYSMEGPASNGVTKLKAIKAAATTLVDDLLTDDSGKVKFALVPYSDHVNVGKSNRNESWVSVPADKAVQGSKTNCTTANKQVCTSHPTKECSATNDGITRTWTCADTSTCNKYESKPVESCEAYTWGYTATWHGCIQSRLNGNKASTTDKGSEPYLGFIGTSAQCVTPIIPLTADKQKMRQGIADMIDYRGGYFPETYIPAGLMWGLNVLSPAAPFSEGGKYQSDGGIAKKVAVLMTDGANTLRVRTAEGKDSLGNELRGRHIAQSISNPGLHTQEKKDAREATLETCQEMKKNGIEIYTVAFMVEDVDGKAVMEGCATSPNHYFDASDSAKLSSAFGQIGSSLRMVRLVN